MAEPTPADPDAQLEDLCRVLNHYEVTYLVFGSHVPGSTEGGHWRRSTSIWCPHASGRTSTA